MRFFRYLSKLLTNEKNKITRDYLNTPLRKSEFAFCIILYISLAICCVFSLVHDDFIQILGQIQTFVALYMAFRFGFFGLKIVIFFNTIEASGLLQIYFTDYNVGTLAGLVAKILTILSSIIVSILANNSHMQKQKLQAQKMKLEQLTIIDDLTGAYNQRFFNSTLESEMESAKKSNASIGLIFIDIDNFKMYNDVYGHDCGDTVLKGTSAILKTIIGEGNFVCRYGGDEFAAILPNSDLQSTKHIADKLHREYETLKNNYYPQNVCSKVTLSMGLSVYPDMAKDKDTLISQADMALYHSKNLGKNNINFYQDIIEQIRKYISSDHQQLIGVFRAFLSTISAKDKYTHGHSERVSSYAVIIGEAMNLSLREISTLQYAGLLHDIGKIEIPKSVLNKVELLCDEEVDIIKKHPVYSANILEPLGGMDQLIEYVLHHHERYDGTGYPHGLKGKDISIGARILCVADSFDAMLSDRPYSKGISIEDAFHELEKHAGTQFDPEIVKIFISAMKERQFKAVG